jgi:prefoldin alpha subunit
MDKEGREKAGHEMQESLQEKAILYQILQKHLENLTQNAVMLERRYEEIEATRMALEDIGKLKEKNEILIPLGSGFFTYGRITEPGKMLADAGAGMFMDKDSASSKALLADKKEEIEKIAGELQNEMSEVSSRLNSLTSELESMSRQAEHMHEQKGLEGDKSHLHSRPGKGHSHKEEQGGG